MNSKVMNPAALQQTVNQAGTLLARSQEYLTGSGTLAGAIALNLDIEQFMQSKIEVIDNPHQLQLAGRTKDSNALHKVLGIEETRAETLRDACAEAIKKDIYLKQAGSTSCGPEFIMHRATAECCTANETAFVILSVHEAITALATKSHTIEIHLTKKEPVKP